MKREEFEHAVRAAGAVLGVHEVLVIGSQALHASVEYQSDFNHVLYDLPRTISGS